MADKTEPRSQAEAQAAAQQQQQAQARVGAGGVLVVDPVIRPPEPPLVGDTPIIHRELQSVRAAPEGEQPQSPTIFARPYGSEPRNIDPATGAVVPMSEEQRAEQDEEIARRLAATEIDREEQERAAEARRQGDLRVNREKIEAQKGRVQEARAKLEEERKANEENRKGATEAAQKARETQPTAGTRVATEATGRAQREATARGRR